MVRTEAHVGGVSLLSQQPRLDAMDAGVCFPHRWGNSGSISTTKVRVITRLTWTRKLIDLLDRHGLAIYLPKLRQPFIDCYQVVYETIRDVAAGEELLLGLREPLQLQDMLGENTVEDRSDRETGKCEKNARMRITDDFAHADWIYEIFTTPGEWYASNRVSCTAYTINPTHTWGGRCWTGDG